MNMLEILSGNRDLQAQVEETEHMLTEINVERLPSFSIGFKRGKEEGREEGREEGEAQVVHRLLSRLGATEVSELLGLAPEEVKRLAAKGDGDDLQPSRRSLAANKNS